MIGIPLLFVLVPMLIRLLIPSIPDFFSLPLVKPLIDKFPLLLTGIFAYLLSLALQNARELQNKQGPAA
jgi:hypothetical protein